MPRHTSKPDSRRAAPKQGLVIAAIGFQLMLCTVASAAGACGDTLDRSARRLPAHMAQVLREIVDRHAIAVLQRVQREPGYCLKDCPAELPAQAPMVSCFPARDLLAASLMNLPPPAMG